MTGDSGESDHWKGVSEIAMEKTVAEFFAGIGLMRMGLERTGWDIAWANDIDEEKYAMYKAHFADADEHFVVGDIHNLEGAGAWLPSVTLATASFPCNDLSLAGARRGLNGKASSAFWGFVKVLRKMDECRPAIVLLENVLGFLTSHKGEDLRCALHALNDLGYQVDAFILNAAWFVPQSRPRIFVVGVQGERKGPALLEQALIESQTRPKALARFIATQPELAWHIRKLPEITGNDQTLEDVLEDLPDEVEEWWSKERAEYLLNQMSQRHRAVAEKMIAGKKYSYGTVFRRVRNKRSMAELRTDGIAGCLRTPRGGSGRQILFRGGHGAYAVRLLTPRECARLMGADDFTLRPDLPLNRALFGFGDAVCVSAIEWIARHYLNPVVDELSEVKA